MKSSQIIIILTLLLSRGYIMGQDELKELNQIYKKVEVSSIKIKQDEMLNKIHSIIDGMNNFTEEKVGKSFEGRDIYLIKFGIGGRKVLLWSQMHGMNRLQP